MRWKILVPLAALLSFRCALTQIVQFRTGTGEDIAKETCIDALREPEEQRAVSEAAIEKHPDFTLGIIEFTDEGLAWSSKQRHAVLDLLRSDEVTTTGAIIVVFVHGWKHNASICDDNVACFRRVLAGLARVEEYSPLPGPHRKIIGIYLGWRGLQYCSEPSRTLSIWSRKRVGERLGQSQGREVIREILRAYAGLIANEGTVYRTRLIVAGHSLGAGVVYSAFGPLMRQALSDAIANRTGPTLGVIKTAGDLPLPDLVVLANPAFEAEYYKRTNLDLMKMERERLHFAPDQLPLLLTVSSERDWATRRIFPPAQFIRYALSPFEWSRGIPFLRRSLVGVGNFKAFVTDRLDSVNSSTDGKQKSSGRNGPQQKSPTSCFTGDWAALTGLGCKCAEVDDADGEPYLGKNALLPCTEEQFEQGSAVKTCAEVRMTHLRPNLDTTNPFIVATSAGTIIKDHNDIYNREFIRFLISFISAVDIKIENKRKPS
ncbi:MAG: hypothetical protein DMF56_21095 [Acidobacteria bacterium]|nr:MAG: hypothetical protein DMF56_21095 [Acidobacteriota bacterium]